MKRRVIHLAAKVAQDNTGRVSALCFEPPRAIDLTRATWTLTKRFVTCRHCQAKMRAAS